MASTNPVTLPWSSNTKELEITDMFLLTEDWSSMMRSNVSIDRHKVELDVMIVLAGLLSTTDIH
jgi:hypothetical protein